MNLKSKLFIAAAFAILTLHACRKNSMVPLDNGQEAIVPEKINSFSETAMIDLGGATASEISAYDPLTKKLFVVSNDGGTKVEVVSLANYPTVNKLATLTFPNNAGINSVAVNNGLLAIALDGVNKQANGDVVVLNTTTLAEVKKVTVGAMPDMVTFSPDAT
jgi:YVTN family beta-propeller protein